MNDSTTIISLVAGGVILLVVLCIFLGLQMKAMQGRLGKLSYRLHFELTRKADILPLIIDKLKEHSLNDGVDEIIELRSQTAALSKLDTQKQDLENSLWEKFGEIWRKAKTSDVGKNDHRMLALESDLDDADARISEIKEHYNNYVKKYNALAGNFLLKPIAIVVKAKKAMAF